MEKEKSQTLLLLKVVNKLTLIYSSVKIVFFKKSEISTYCISYNNFTRRQF